MNMYLIPFESYTLSTKLQKREIDQRVDYLLNKSAYNRDRLGGLISTFEYDLPNYKGFIDDSGFQLERGSENRKQFPYISGTITEGSQSEIMVKVGNPIEANVIYILSIIILFCIETPRIINLMNGGYETLLSICTPILALIFIVFFFSSRFKTESKKIRKNLLLLFEAEIKKS